MDNTSPGQPVLRRDTNPAEQVLSSWTEPNAASVAQGQLPFSYIIAATSVLVVILLIIGWAAADGNFYFAALVIAMAGVAVAVQHRKPPKEREIIIATDIIQIGRHVYPLETLAGFWLEQAGEVIAVNLEPKKASMLPINLLYPSANAQEARAAFSQVMPELEPRENTAADSLSRYIRF